MNAAVETYARFDLAVLAAERFDHLDDDGPVLRELLARHILAVVAQFAGRIEVSEKAMAGVVDTDPGESVTFAAERQIREHADDAEAGALYLTGRTRTDVLCQVLDELALLDDYMRIKKVEQCWAFGQDRSPAEDDAHSAHLHREADRSADMEAWSARRALEDLRLCRCGKNYGRYRRDRCREPWWPRDSSLCPEFRDADEVPVPRAERGRVGGAGSSVPRVGRRAGPAGGRGGDGPAGQQDERPVAGAGR